MLLSDLLGEIAESIRVHHASGHFDRDEATWRLTGGCGMSDEQAQETLALPVGDDLFGKYRTWPKTAAQ